MSRVFVIGDLHFPYHSKKALKEVYKAIKKEKPQVIVQLGDILDQYVFSKYTRSSSISVEEDIQRGLEEAEKFWKTVKKLAPRAKCYQLLGNHDDRLIKRIQEKLPELAEVFDFELYQFKGVTTLKSSRDFLEIDGVVYIHGYLTKSLDHAKHFNKPTVHGHRHRPCIEVEGRLWSMDVGYLADPNSLPLSYGPSKMNKWRHAYGLVINGSPDLRILAK